MNKIFFKSLLCLAFLVPTCSIGNAQSFNPGSLVISASEGGTTAHYSTNDGNGTNHSVKDGNVGGNRDPLIVEYGVSRKVSIGLTMGTDLYNIDASKYYAGLPTGTVGKIMTSELTFDVGYHFFVTKHTDISAFGGFGPTGINMKVKQSDYTSKYDASGMMVRTGIKARYYFFRHLGVTGMLTAFSANCNSLCIKDNSVANDYSTSIKGLAIEFGLCYRIRR